MPRSGFIPPCSPILLQFCQHFMVSFVEVLGILQIPHKVGFGLRSRRIAYHLFFHRVRNIRPLNDQVENLLFVIERTPPYPFKITVDYADNRQYLILPKDWVGGWHVGVLFGVKRVFVFFLVVFFVGKIETNGIHVALVVFVYVRLV